MVSRDDTTELTAHQRAVMVKSMLDAGEKLLISEIAKRTGLTLNGAKYMMAMISAVAPVTEIDGLWQRIWDK
jgi:hypothetical protein